MAGIEKYKVIQQTDGKSIVPILKNSQYTDTSRILVWHFPNKANRHGPGINYASAIRQGNWKMIYIMKQRKLKLYNLKRDIGEQHDLAERYSQKTNRLAQLLTEKLKSWHAQMPKYKADNRQVPWPDEVIK